MHSQPEILIKDVPGGFPKSDLLGVTVALIKKSHFMVVYQESVVLTPV